VVQVAALKLVTLLVLELRDKVLLVVRHQGALAEAAVAQAQLEYLLVVTVLHHL
jgi:hypothetical protein